MRMPVLPYLLRRDTKRFFTATRRARHRHLFATTLSAIRAPRLRDLVRATGAALVLADNAHHLLYRYWLGNSLFLLPVYSAGGSSFTTNYYANSYAMPPPSPPFLPAIHPPPWLRHAIRTGGVDRR